MRVKMRVPRIPVHSLRALAPGSSSPLVLYLPGRLPIEDIRVRQSIADTIELSLMMKLIPAIVIILACSFAAAVAEPAPLTTVQAVYALSNAEAGHSLPVSLESTVTFFR